MQTRERDVWFSEDGGGGEAALSLSRMHYLSSDEAHLSLTCGYFDPKRKKKKKENTPRSTYMYLSVNDSENKQTNKNKM